MVLRSYRLKKKKKRKGGARDLITGGVTAVMGLALLGATANAVSRV